MRFTAAVIGIERCIFRLLKCTGNREHSRFGEQFIEYGILRRERFVISALSTICIAFGFRSDAPSAVFKILFSLRIFLDDFLGGSFIAPDIFLFRDFLRALDIERDFFDVTAEAVILSVDQNRFSGFCQFIIADLRLFPEERLT